MRSSSICFCFLQRASLSLASRSWKGNLFFPFFRLCCLDPYLNIFVGGIVLALYWDQYRLQYYNFWSVSREPINCPWYRSFLFVNCQPANVYPIVRIVSLCFLVQCQFPIVVDWYSWSADFPWFSWGQGTRSEQIQRIIASDQLCGEWQLSQACELP